MASRYPRARLGIAALLAFVSGGGPDALAQSRGAVEPTPRRGNDPGLSGSVLTPNDIPVSGGRVIATRSPGGRVTATIDRDGRFRLIPDTTGPHQVVVAAPGFAPYRFNITVPPSRTVKLPMIRLSPATYFRARFVTAAGEAITSPALRRRSVDANGMTIADPLDGQPADQFETDGTVTIGPLPRGTTMIALDMPYFAQTRLPDLVVTGTDPLLDGGVITIQPGAVLQADIVDEHGAPVSAHEVWIEDAAPQSPLVFRPERTDSHGRALFDRLAPGRYRVWTKTKERCGNFVLALARVVSVGTSGIRRARVVIGGTATFRVVSPLGPMIGKIVRVTPETGTPAPWQPQFVTVSPLARRSPMLATSSTPCTGSTGADGRVTLTNFPPGPANVEVRLFNSTSVKRVMVPEGGREIEIAILDGLIPVHVANQRTNQPVPQAKIVWTGSGGKVEALATPNGDALLEGVGTAAGQLAVTASGYEPLEAHFTEPPGPVQEVALPPSRETRIRARVVSATGDALADAVVERAPTSPMDISDIAVTDAKGFVVFSDVPAGTLRLTAHADGFGPGLVTVSDTNRDAIVVTLVPDRPKARSRSARFTIIEQDRSGRCRNFPAAGRTRSACHRRSHRRTTSQRSC